MRRTLALLLFAAPLPLAAQVPAVGSPGTTARTGVLFESYSFGSGLLFDRVSELTVPLALSQRLGSR